MKIKNKNFKAVLFDMDGVLIDSEIVYLDKIYKKMSEKYKLLKREALYPSVGMDEERTRIFMHNIVGEALNNKQFDLYMEDIYKDIRISDYKEIMNPGVTETLNYLKRNHYKVVLASTSKMLIIKEVLKQCDIESYFDFIISGEQFKESKPNPAIYLTAIKAVGCIPGECVVVEDSDYGIEAGHAAGTYVIAKKDERFNFNQSKADYHINTINEIVDFLEG